MHDSDVSAPFNGITRGKTGVYPVGEVRASDGVGIVAVDGGLDVVGLDAVFLVTIAADGFKVEGGTIDGVSQVDFELFLQFHRRYVVGDAAKVRMIF